MRWTILASAALLATGLAPMAGAHAAVSDFRLPTEPSPQQPPPDRQGPVAPDVPASRGPAPTPTPAPSAAPTPAPAVTPPVLVSPVSPGAPRPSAPAPTRTATPAAATPPATSEATPIEPADAPTPAPPVSASTSTPRTTTGTSPGATGDAATAWWPWLLGGLAGLAALALAGWAWQRRTVRPAVAAQIERPRITPAVAPAAEPTPAPAPRSPGLPLPQPGFGEPLQVSLEPLRLSLTLMNATLAYRLQVANIGPTALTGLTIGADMISAHASLSREEQLSGPSPAGGAGQPRPIERLEPGEVRLVEGEFRLPFQQIVPIRQGNAALLLPLARFRVEAEGAKPVVRTFLVGQPGASERLQPFRLDLGPRVYPTLAQHAFA